MDDPVPVPLHVPTFVATFMTFIGLWLLVSAVIPLPLLPVIIAPVILFFSGGLAAWAMELIASRR